MNKIIRPFGLLGPKYRTDTLGAFYNYLGFAPALVIFGLALVGKSPVTTREGTGVSLLASFLFIAPLLVLAIARSERVR